MYQTNARCAKQHKTHMRANTNTHPPAASASMCGGHPPPPAPLRTPHNKGGGGPTLNNHSRTAPRSWETCYARACRLQHLHPLRRWAWLSPQPVRVDPRHQNTLTLATAGVGKRPWLPNGRVWFSVLCLLAPNAYRGRHQDNPREASLFPLLPQTLYACNGDAAATTNHQKKRARPPHLVTGYRCR